MYSYHIFYFPFKWENFKLRDKTFSNQTYLKHLTFNQYSDWERCPKITDEEENNFLYNEQNYYYPFVHPVLYDDETADSLLMHYERKEPKNSKVTYHIRTNNKSYELEVDSMNLNLYATGVGMLTIYLLNSSEDQKEPEDILAINQYGRRIFPPFIKDVEYRSLIAHELFIEGLNGYDGKYYENFSDYTNRNHEAYRKAWRPTSLITRLISDLIEDVEISPIIDDRMFVNCWYGNDILSEKIKESPDDFMMKEYTEFWYQYVFIDSGGATCRNEAMKRSLLEKQTYRRWQKAGSLFGISRYALLLVTNTEEFAKDVLAVHMRTIYSRMVELAMIQRASILRFSSEVTEVSKLSKEGRGSKGLNARISNLYEEYIRFVNQVYFREVSAQEQGIEMYNLMMETMNIKEYIKDLDDEIGELYQYVSLVDDKARNRNAERLNTIAAIFLPATLFAGIFGMNSIIDSGIKWIDFSTHIGFVALGSLIASLYFLKLKNK